MSKGNLFIVTGPSGAGKGTVLGRLLPSMEQLQYSVSATTRAPREGEEDGVNYYFLNRNDFLNMVDRGEFLEYAEYVGNFYGTPAGPVDECLEKGVDVILEIEVQGALRVKARRPDAILIFMLAPSFRDIEARLFGRGDTAPELIRERLERARWEYTQAGQYDYLVVNDNVDKAVSEILSIIEAEKCKTSERLHLLKEEL